MTPLQQAERPIGVASPLGEDALVFRSMRGTDRLSSLYEYELDVLSERHDIELEELLGKSVTVRVALPDDKVRHFNGFVSRFSMAGQALDTAVYRLTLRPWLWFLTRRANCRIFQNMNVSDIISEVFHDADFDQFKLNLNTTHPSWEYCVQYRETDFNFVSRLMEQQGIYYYFDHSDGGHVLVMTDDPGIHKPFPGYEEIRYLPPSENVITEDDFIFDWNLSKEIQPVKYALNDFDFKKPKVPLATAKSLKREHEMASYEVYDYPGAYLETGDGEWYAQCRIEELQSRFERARGVCNARGVMVGSLFKMVDHPRGDQNREYLVISASYDLKGNLYETGGDDESTSYSCMFTAVDSKQPYRSSRETPKPIVQGPQTALVVGPDGEEIYTDEYGRVKVHFHWDRNEEYDENNSCWIRVAQAWAGRTWGGIQIPRIGEEVIVDFLEGDPDRPIITGRVYNADSMPPYKLPENKTQSGMKSRSTKEGTGENFNEFRFEDKKDSEEIYLHAEKDYNQITENDRTEDVGHDRALHVAHNKSEAIDNDKSIQVGLNHSEVIGANKSLSVGGSHTEQITGTMSQTVSQSKSEAISIAKALTVGAAYQITVGAAMNTTVGASKSEEVGAFRTGVVGGNDTEEIGGKKKVSTGGDYSLTTGNSLNITVKDKGTVSVSKNLDIGSEKILNIKAADSIVIQSDKDITLRSGKAEITLKKDGKIDIKGAKINVKGTGDVKIKGSKVALN